MQVKRDPVYSWKALRQVSRASLQTFSKMLNPAAAAKQRPGPGGGAKPGLPAPAEPARKEAPAAKLDLEDAVHELYPVCAAIGILPLHSVSKCLHAITVLPVP